MPTGEPRGYACPGVAGHLREAYGFIAAGHLERAIDLCEEILLGAPRYEFAAGVARYCRRLEHTSVDRRLLLQQLEEWHAQTPTHGHWLPEERPLFVLGPEAFDSLTLLLQTSPLRRRPKGISGGERLEASDYVFEAGIYRRLDNEPFHLEPRWTSLSGLLDDLRFRTGLSIVPLPGPFPVPDQVWIEVRPTLLGDGVRTALASFRHELRVLPGGELIAIPSP